MDKMGKFFAGLMIGSIVGGLLGLILAPSAGEETRNCIKDKVYYVRDEVKKAAAERSDELKKELAALQNRA